MTIKRPINALLLTAGLLSLALCLWVWIYDTSLILYAAFLPAFFFQLLLCRMTVPGSALRRVPVIGAVVGVAAGLIASTGSFWLSLYLLVLSVPTALGCLLALAVQKFCCP